MIVTTTSDFPVTAILPLYWHDDIDSNNINTGSAVMLNIFQRPEPVGPAVSATLCFCQPLL